MKVIDIRPSLASWPKRIYEWHELPEKFRPALEAWKNEGMEPGNVTYIPKISLAAKEPEVATAWWKDQVMIQSNQNGITEQAVLTKGDVPALVYEHQSLRCTIILPRKDGKDLEFGFAQVKEDQIFPVINLLLGQPADRPMPYDHPDDSLSHLMDTTLMYHPSILLRRFDDNINDYVWFRSSVRVLPFLNRRKPHPEYFLANMDRGFAVIDRNFYRKRVYYYTWDDVVSIKMLPHQWKKRPGVTVKTKSGMNITVPLLKDNVQPVADYLERLKSQAPAGVEIGNDTAGLFDK